VHDTAHIEPKHEIRKRTGDEGEYEGPIFQVVEKCPHLAILRLSDHVYRSGVAPWAKRFEKLRKVPDRIVGLCSDAELV